jgi:YihY family inner membrane protein
VPDQSGEGAEDDDGGLADRLGRRLGDRGQRAFALLRAIATHAQERRITFLAAAVAYYAFVSILPLMLVAVVVTTTIGGEALAETVLESVSEFLSPSGQDLFLETLTSGEGRTSVSVVGSLVLLWSALKVFRGLDLAFSEVYGVEGEETLLDQVRDGLLVLASVGVALLAVAVVGVVTTLFADPVTDALAPVLLLLSLIVALFPLYYVFPDVETTVVDAMPGTVVVAFGWTLLSAAFTVYADVAGTNPLYGALGAVLLVLTWLYLAAVLVLLGATVNAVLDDRHVPEGRDRTGSYKPSAVDHPRE